jgi:DNA replication protein DnaC
MVEVCGLCEGSGLRVVREDGRMVARPCECRIALRAERILAKARIPKRFRDCSFENYETALRSLHPSLKKALHKAKHYCQGYPVETAGKGILFTGSSGLGKTHLAVSILKGLINDRGASGIFWEQKELLETLRSTYEQKTLGAENGILNSVLKCDVLVLDDLGDMTPSDWSWDTTSYILNSRYNENLSTIITTNLENSARAPLPADPHDMFEKARRANTQMTLGDQIGERMRSRIQEMCVLVEMRGEDFRQKVKRASFADNTADPIEDLATRPADDQPQRNSGTLVKLMLSGRDQVDGDGAAALKQEQEKPPVGANRMGKNKREPRDLNSW